ncbi:MAG: phosphotransferase, partial [Candidatus Rokubacteria bacterium]|nr:phosphotransferase [Candidatus Rokubacteria bacterium]
GSVPVPKVIHAATRGLEELPPFALMRFVEGISFRELRRTGDADAIAQAAFSAGETLAAIGRTTFSKPGWLSAGPAVTAPLLEGANPMPRFVDSCLASENLQRRLPADLRDRIHTVLWASSAALAVASEETRLVHGDFNKRNLLVRPEAGRWIVAAVVDWEFAVSGSPLADLGNFLRYELASRPLAEPHFSTGYRQAGGALPPDWRHVSKLVDLTAVCESLTHDSLPATVAAELVEIARATVGNRDPRFDLGP